MMAAHSHTRCLHHLFEAQVERTPAATAVVGIDQELTYEQLNRQANQLAHYLRKRGVGPEVFVGLGVKRSPEMLVGLLGVLKAGGAYVPLELAYPQERLAFMLKDTRAQVLVTLAQTVTKLPTHQAEVICLDTDWEIISRESTENPITTITPENLACVFYTSGSTGKPKGVMLPHRSVVNYTEIASVEFALQPSDRVLQFASISFDVSLEEIFPCLSRGATLVLRSEAMAESCLTLLQQCHDLALTVLDLPTGYWHELTTQLEFAKPFAFPSSLRLVIIGGEKVLRERVRVWQEHVGHRIRLINAYGPTEATISATMYEVPGAVEVTSQEVPIGRPLRGVETQVLDQHLQPVPTGEAGELYIGGVGLARGYLHRPELTAERFVCHPFSTDPGARLYKTGDLVRFLPDGTLEFLGRIDQQVKIRGFRIELEEIEAVLSRHPAVQQVVVVAREDTPGDRRLVAYVVARQASVSASELRCFVQEQLPAHMAPAAVVWVERLPLTPNGKVDRQALPAPSEARPPEARPVAPPRDQLEAQLVQIWETVFQLKPVSVQDNFFELGGHSLLAVRLCGQMERVVGKALPPALLFQAPTIAQLARLVRQEGQRLPSSIVPVQPRGAQPPLFCVHGYDGYLALTRHLGPEQPFYGLVQHLPGQRVRHTRVEDLAAHYLQELQGVQPRGPYWLCGHSFGALVAFEMAQQLVGQGQRVSFLGLLDPLPLTAPAESPGQSASSGLCSQPVRLLAQLHRLRSLPARLRYHLKEAVCLTYHILGQPLPARLYRFYVEEVVYGRFYAQAARAYVPRRYAGRITLFHTAHSGAAVVADWERVAAGELEVYETPGTHLAMIQEPHVRILVEKLRACLERAREGMAGSERLRTVLSMLVSAWQLASLG